MWDSSPSGNMDDRIPPPPPPMQMPFPSYPIPEYDDPTRGMFSPGYYSHTSPTYLYERIIYYGDAPPPSAFNNAPYVRTQSFAYQQPEPESYTRTRATSHSHNHHSHSHSRHHHHHHHRHSHSPQPAHAAPAAVHIPPPPPQAFPARPASAQPAVPATKVKVSWQATGKPGKPKPGPSQPDLTRATPLLKAHPDFRYSKCSGRKKALCIGINYRGQPNELRGCINDARHIRNFLIKQSGFREGDIVMLTDESKNPRRQPTRKNILDAIRWLVRNAKPHDSLFFHYSGHGGQTKDLNGDEIDGWDEVIFPVDFKTNGHILDDELNATMVKPLPAGCRLTALFDSCHSGTVLDLPFIYSSHGRLKGSHITPRFQREYATPSDVISWSACKDGQTSADTFAGGQAVGAMSYAFIQSLTRNPKQTYQELLRSVRLILNPKFDQKPQLGSSHPIDTTLPFIL